MTTTATVTPEVLEELVPLRELDQEALDLLLEELEIEDFPARSVVFKKGSTDPWTRYLVSGALVLVDQPGAEEHTLVGMGDSAVVTQPLGYQQPYEYTAIARTDVRVLRFRRESILQLLEDHRLPQYDVAEVDEEQEDSGSQLFYRLFQDLMEDKLALPSMPDVAVRVREAISDPETGASEVAKIVQADPVVATRLMRVANSAAFSGAQPVDSLTAAIVRLGLKTTREIVMAVTLQEVFRSKNPLINKRMVELWMHSTMIAALATVMARKLRGFSPDRALLAGLIHDIGAVPMLVHAHEYPELAQDPALLESTLEAYRGQVGAMILRRWNFPEDLISVPLEAEEWDREHDGTPDVADLIIAAQLQSLNDAGAAGQHPNLSETAVYRKLGLEALGVTDSAPVMEEAREEIAEVQRVLMGD